MKKVILAFAAMVATIGVQAQTNQGRLFINGQISAYSQSVERDDDEKASGVALTPSVGYFVADRFAIGLGLGIESQRSEDIINNTERSETSSQVTIAPFARYYVPTSNDKFHFFAQARLGIGFGNTKTKNGSVTVESGKYQAIDFAISPGFAYFPSDHWSVELSFRGLFINSNNPDGNDNNTTTVGLGVNSLAPSVGVSYFF
jgi:outer membrane protein